MQPYERTQHAMWMWLVLAIPIAILAGAWTVKPDPAMGLPAAVAIVPVLLIGTIFTRLTIAVDAHAVRWHFGWGWPRGSIAISEIEHTQIARTSLLEGWGIHWTIWHGWLWNVGGFQAVEITKTDGSLITLGTDDPQGLLQAIERFRKGAA